jgi:hypothetical protein
LKMKSFLFIVPLTPSDYLTPLRKELFDLFLAALNGQKYKNWQALLVGEEDRTEGNMVYKKITGRSKEVKLMFAHEYISSLADKPDYIIRIDDDDLISPDVLQYVSDSAVDFDCMADKFHCYYDIVSGKICQVKNTWLPNTVIHKTEHALSKFGRDNIPLMLLDHSKDWMEYYSTKKIAWAEKNAPVYLRVMSPTTGTSNMHTLRLLDFTDAMLSQYESSISRIGKWKHMHIASFDRYINKLKGDWKSISGRDIVSAEKKTGLLNWFK